MSVLEVMTTGYYVTDKSLRFISLFRCSTSETNDTVHVNEIEFKQKIFF